MEICLGLKDENMEWRKECPHITQTLIKSITVFFKNCPWKNKQLNIGKFTRVW